MLRLLSILILAGVMMPGASFALPEVKTTFPRLANYFLHWTISEEEARELARFDLVILDADVQNRSRAELQLLRRLNPKLILLAYVPASEIRADAGNLAVTSPLRYKLGQAIPEEWYLKDAQGQKRSFWSGTWILNVSNVAPRYGGRVWNEFLPEFVAREIFSTGFWDGVFYDNGWDEIVHFAKGVPDLNGDRQTDETAEANRKWQEGLRTLYANTVAIAPDKLVTQNDGVIYAPAVHGVMLENFPRKGWSRYMQDLRAIKERAKNPATPILNATTFNSGARENWQAMRYGLATALLSDAFYSFDFGDQDHGQTWFYDEYEAFLGEPLGEARSGRVSGGATSQSVQSGLWRRDFEKGIAFVNSGAEARSVELPIEVEKLRGRQDLSVNDGVITRQLRIQAQDGLIVLRPLKTIVGAPFENGIFARVFSADGQVARAGFFAYERGERSGVVMASADLDGDARVERVKKLEQGQIRVDFGDGQQTSFTPFGSVVRSEEMSLALGDVTGEGVKEIVVSYRGQVRIYRIDGTLLAPPFYPFGMNYRGSVNVAVGDLNSDRFSEIVVGAGAGGGPQVRIFSGEGRLLSGGFFAYDPRFRGGVRVAVGDIDGDNRAEIVTGPGIGGGPQIRIFNNKGQTAGPGFFAFDQSARGGVIPIVADADGDGRNEILAVSKEM